MKAGEYTGPEFGHEAEQIINGITAIKEYYENQNKNRRNLYPQLFKDDKCYTNETIGGRVLIEDKDTPNYLKYYVCPRNRLRGVIIKMADLDGDLSDLSYCGPQESRRKE